MPNRVLRDWTDSENVHNLSAEAERFFTRLIMKADDFGRYLGNMKLLKSTLFPLHDDITDTQISRWLNECISASLVFKYEVESKAYIEIKAFDQKGLKVRRSKYPPSSESDRYELIMGYVYIIGTSFDRPVKIGFSMNPWSRLKEITANHPEDLKVLISFKAEKRTESMLHMELKGKRIKNEWFQLSQPDFEAFNSMQDGNLTVEALFELLRSNYESSTVTTHLETKKKPKQETEEETETNTAVPFLGEVLKTWLEWEKFRKEKKQKITPTTVKKQIQFLGGRGDPEIIAILNRSMTNGWTGLFELPKNNHNGNRDGNKETVRRSDAVVGEFKGFGKWPGDV